MDGNTTTGALSVTELRTRPRQSAPEALYGLHLESLRSNAIAALDAMETATDAGEQAFWQASATMKAVPVREDATGLVTIEIVRRPMGDREKYRAMVMAEEPPMVWPSPSYDSVADAILDATATLLRHDADPETFNFAFQGPEVPANVFTVSTITHGDAVTMVSTVESGALLPDYERWITENPESYLSRSAPVTIPEGERNNTFAILAGSMQRQGFSDRAIREALHLHNADACSPPMDRAEVDKIADSITRYEKGNDAALTAQGAPIREALLEKAEGKKARSRFSLVPLSEVTASQPDWLIEGYLERDSVSVIFGESESGKSFAAIDMVSHIATGTPWARGIPVKQQTGVYIGAEGARGIKRRFDGWEILHQAPIPQGRVLMSQGNVELTDPGSLQSVTDALDALPEPPAIIVIDTLARTMGAADENSTKDMNAFVRALDDMRTRTGAAIVVVHHVGLADKDRARGSSVLRAALDFEYQVVRLGKDEIEGFTLVPKKTKDHAHPPVIAFKFEKVETPEGQTIVPVFRSEVTAEDRKRGQLPRNAQRIIDIMRQPGDDGEGNLQGTVYRGYAGMTEDQIKEAWKAAGYHRTGYYDGINQLIDRGLIEHTDGLYLLKA